jgi:hypothetical protein
MACHLILIIVGDRISVDHIWEMSNFCGMRLPGSPEDPRSLPVFAPMCKNGIEN